MKAAVIGDPIFISGFMMAGAEGFEAEDEGKLTELVRLLKELADSGKYAVIILPERFVEHTLELRSRLIREGRVAPIFAFVPDYSGIKGKRIEELRRTTSLAVGAELKL